MGPVKDGPFWDYAFIIFTIFLKMPAYLLADPGVSKGQSIKVS